MLKEKSQGDIVHMQTDIIKDSIAYKQMVGWEIQARAVNSSYSGNIFPTTNNVAQTDFRRIAGTTAYWDFWRSVDRISYLNPIKRQHRVLANYLRNNEPKYLISEDPYNFDEDPNTKVEETDMVSARSLLDNVFGRKGTAGFGKNAPFTMSFWDSIMNDNIDWALLRGYAVTFAWWDKDDQQIKFKIYDPFDIHYKLNVRRLSEAREILYTYTKTREEMIAEYPKDCDGNDINWKEEAETTMRTESPYKSITILEPANKDIYLLREGWYEDFEQITDDLDQNIVTDKVPVVYRIITTKTKCIYKQKIEWLTFIPKVIFAPLSQPDELLPRSWYADLVNLTIEANKIFQKLMTIVHTQGTRIYVKKGTKITKAVGKVFNELGLEVYEVDGSQTLPQQAQMVNFTADMVNGLNMIMSEIEKEWGISGEMMGGDTSAGNDQSGRAIMALQAGSKNNVGMILDALNIYMTNMSKLVMKLYEIYGPAIIKVYWKNEAGMSGSTDLSKDKLKGLNVKVSVAPKSAWDEISQQAQTMQFLDILQRFNPDLKISPDILANIMSITNDHIPKITMDIEKTQDPDIQIATGENMKIIAGAQLNANQADKHETHIAIHSTMLKSLTPDNPVAQALILHIKQHEANLWPAPMGQK